MAVAGPFYTTSQLYQFANNAGFTGAAADTAVAIAKAESAGGAGSTNVNTNGTIDRGLLQINSSHGYGTSSFDPQTSFNQGFSISKGGTDFSPWSTYNSGAFQSFLNTDTGVGTGTDTTSNTVTDSSGTTSFTVANPSGTDISGTGINDPGTAAGTGLFTGSLAGLFFNPGYTATQSASTVPQAIVNASTAQDKQAQADIAAQGAQAAQTSASWFGSFGDWFQRGGILLLAILAGVAALIWLALETKAGRATVTAISRNRAAGQIA